MIEQKKIDDQNLILLKNKDVFDDEEVKNYAKTQILYEKSSTMNYIKNEVQNSLNRNEILEVKLYLLK